MYTRGEGNAKNCAHLLIWIISLIKKHFFLRFFFYYENTLISLVPKRLYKFLFFHLWIETHKQKVNRFFTSVFKWLNKKQKTIYVKDQKKQEGSNMLILYFEGSKKQNKNNWFYNDVFSLYMYTHYTISTDAVIAETSFVFWVI